MDTNLNDYLIPASQAKRAKGFFYIRAEKQSIGDGKGTRELRYTLELCREKRKHTLIGWYWHRSDVYDCWIVKPECKIQNVWIQHSKFEHSYQSVATLDEIREMMKKALELS